MFCFCVEIFRITIFFPWKRHTHYITLYFLAQKKPLRNLKMPSGCKRERNVFTILNFCVARYRLFDDTQELRQEWKLEKIKSSFFFQKIFCLLHSRIWHGLFANICRKHGSIRYHFIFFINLWWFSIFFTFRFIRRNVCYHLQRTFLMWFDKIP